MTWQCEQCGELHEDRFRQCWRCAAEGADGGRPAPREFWSRRYWLFGVKILGCISAGAMLYQAQGGPFPVTVLFGVVFACSLACFHPRIGFIGPWILAGFYLGPKVFAAAMDGSRLQSITLSVLGGIFGLIVGIALEFGMEDPGELADGGRESPDEAG